MPVQCGKILPLCHLQDCECRHPGVQPPDTSGGVGDGVDSQNLCNLSDLLVKGMGVGCKDLATDQGKTLWMLQTVTHGGDIMVASWSGK